ncbi:hypothetical protein IAG44_00705 [Streptomyces roseirectus]|uniref:Uncharacterized protein n=1 Tax=Streptomyces roseirectus TaxID=2768066 RepID=A0A7H0I5R6_9ACTN|nr:hypothetical protein [Streptomyces roseirectus]QNP68132.1 hypothetical protein IAG44_00705 [Streptomyces roseirectus]
MPVPEAVDAVGGDAYRRAVEDAVRGIRGGRPEKVTLSRTLPLPADVDIVATYVHVPAAPPEAGGGRITARPLAGSRWSPST